MGDYSEIIKQNWKLQQLDNLKQHGYLQNDK